MRSTAIWAGCGCNLQAGINQPTSAGAIVARLLNYNAAGRIRFWLSAIERRPPGNRWPEFTAEFPETLKCVAFIMGRICRMRKSPGRRKIKFMTNSFSGLSVSGAKASPGHAPS